MTLSLWNFINILLSIFALGVVVGITATLIGLTVTSHIFGRKRYLEEGDNDGPAPE